MNLKKYNSIQNTLEAARERISMLFDNFELINVSVSGGKDSTVLYYLCLQEAIKRNRKITVFFLDQEAEYQASIDIIEKQMTHANVIPAWYQIPIYLTNATSYEDFFLYGWGHNEKWMRKKHPLAVKRINEEYPQRFYKFFTWYEKQNPDAAYLVGIRAEEGVIRFRAVTKYEGWNGLKWSSNTDKINKFYPIYDWTVYDIWKFIYDYNLPYNKIYDLMFIDGYSLYTKMRVSNLIHEKSFKCLADLPKYEPETFNKLSKRISGISTASRYASEKIVFNNKVLPSHYDKWEEFRDFLLQNIATPDHKEIFMKRFDKQDKNECTYKAQVGQLLINDYENSKSFDTKKEEKKQKEREKWNQIL
jgi:predicted phosphoadenosine phosphosulfate sulfurtransferase